MSAVPFMDELNEYLREDERIFKVRAFEQIANKCFKLVLMVNAKLYDEFLDDRLRNKVTNAVGEVLGGEVEVKVTFVKTITEPELVQKCIFQYVFNEYPAIFPSFKDCKIIVNVINDLIDVEIQLQSFLYSFFNEERNIAKLEEELDDYFMEDNDVRLVEVPNEDSQLEVSHKAVSQIIGTRYVDVTVGDCYLSSLSPCPRYIMDVNNKEAKQVTVCGRISNVKTKDILKYDKVLYTCLINDTTGSLPIKLFARNPKNDRQKKKVDWNNVFAEGSTLLVKGDINFDTYENRLAMVVTGVASCFIAYNSINVKSDYHTEVNPEYLKIFPRKYQDMVQDDFFSSKTMCKDLMEKEYIVFDLETTGLDPTKCGITDIGAVKVVNGAITEVFQTLINPQMSIPEEIVEKTHITDEMVKDSPLFSDIVADIYKFFKGYILVGHNVTFDLSFLSFQSKKCKYEFDNSYVDTLALSRQILPNLKKHKLDSVCSALNVSLVDAHRALNDAMATARIFVKLINLRSKNQ